jgi:hypothetical protein
MLWAPPPPWSELVANNKLPKDFDDPQACSEELTEELRLLQLQPYATRRPVLDVPGNVCKVVQLLVGINQVDGLVIIHPGDVGEVVIRHGGEGGRRSEGSVRLVVRCGCVCVYVLLAFCVKAGGSALILLNHGMVPVFT